MAIHSACYSDQATTRRQLGLFYGSHQESYGRLSRRLGTRRLYYHARQQRALDLIHKNRRPFSTPHQGPWRVVLRIQESADCVPVRLETVPNHQRCEKNNASRRNNSSDGWQLVTNMSEIKNVSILNGPSPIRFRRLGFSKGRVMPACSTKCRASPPLRLLRRQSALGL